MAGAAPGRGRSLCAPTRPPRSIRDRHRRCPCKRRSVDAPIRTDGGWVHDEGKIGAPLPGDPRRRLIRPSERSGASPVRSPGRVGDRRGAGHLRPPAASGDGRPARSGATSSARCLGGGRAGDGPRSLAPLLGGDPPDDMQAALAADPDGPLETGWVVARCQQLGRASGVGLAPVHWAVASAARRGRILAAGWLPFGPIGVEDSGDAGPGAAHRRVPWLHRLRCDH